MNFMLIMILVLKPEDIKQYNFFFSNKIPNNIYENSYFIKIKYSNNLFADLQLRFL